MDTSPAEASKKIKQSLFINSALAIYAVCTFIGALKSGVAWRILLSGTGMVLFVTAIVILVLKLIKLSKDLSASN